MSRVLLIICLGAVTVFVVSLAIFATILVGALIVEFFKGRL